MHSVVHVMVTVFLAIAAYFLMPRRGKPRPETAATPPTALLADEIDRLQRELDEAQKSRDFAEELLRKRQGPSQPGKDVV